MVLFGRRLCKLMRRREVGSEGMKERGRAGGEGRGGREAAGVGGVCRWLWIRDLYPTISRCRHGMTKQNQLFAMDWVGWWRSSDWFALNHSHKLCTHISYNVQGVYKSVLFPWKFSVCLPSPLPPPTWTLNLAVIGCQIQNSSQPISVDCTLYTCTV